ncbi:signal peptide peptidase SppA [Candidatus Parcubacteria bacterium]|nr:signal peptide peptidase SppA [Candidatus Parcubacteria bacterium]
MKFKIFDGERDRVNLKRIGIAIVVIACLITIKDEILWNLEGEEYFTDESSYNSEDYGDDSCNVVKIQMQGDLFTFEELYASQEYDVVSSESIVDAINQIEEDKSIKAFVLEIDSYGGLPVAGEEVANALKRTNLPTVALIRSAGLSAAYWASTGADVIIASENSDVGSIGVTMSYLDYTESNQENGMTYNQLSSGKYKDTGDPDKALTGEEKQYLLRDVNIMAENFIKVVSENRNLDIEKVRALADGSSMLGQMALENGLIDKIGDLQTAKEYLEKEIGEPVEICWFE